MPTPTALRRAHVAIDARMIQSNSMHGIARYVYELLACLREQAEDFRFSVLVNHSSPLLLEEWPDHMELVLVKSRWISLREQWELPRLLKERKVDLLHAPSFVAP